MGCLQIPAAQLDSSEKFIRLWVHESHRIFADRLIDTADQDTFFEIMKDSTQDNFKVSLEKVLSHLSQGTVFEINVNLNFNNNKLAASYSVSHNTQTVPYFSDNYLTPSRRVWKRIIPQLAHINAQSVSHFIGYSSVLMLGYASQAG